MPGWRILVVAEEPSKFEEWQRAQLQPARHRQVIITAKGLTLFQTSNLHQLSWYPRSSWSGFAGRAGSHTCSQPQTTRRRCSENTPANMRLWLKSPQHIKPGALMPDFTFTDEQLDELSEYLSSLR